MAAEDTSPSEIAAYSTDVPSTEQEDEEMTSLDDDASEGELDMDVDNPSSQQVKVSPMNPKYSYREHAFIVTIALVLSFNSGFSNGLCLSRLVTSTDSNFRSESTSAYTGTYTVSALALASVADQSSHQFNPRVSNLEYFGFLVTMILAFILGSTISGLLNPRPFPWRLAPMYAPAFPYCALFMIIAAILLVRMIQSTMQKVDAFTLLQWPMASKWDLE